MTLKKRKKPALCAVPGRRGSRRRVPCGTLKGNVADYGMKHRPTKEGPPLSDVLEPGSFAPKDIYTAPPNWYSAFPNYAWEVVAKMREKRGHPEAGTFVWRAGPTAELNPGDWIALSPEYAKQHRDSIDPESYKVCRFNVPAGEIRWAGDDLMEWGYWGNKTKKAAWGNCLKSSKYRGPKARKGAK
jgi:hypothetical protein